MYPAWLRWTKHLQSIAQDGPTYTRGHHDAERHEQLREVTAEILSEYSTSNLAEARELLNLQAGTVTPKVDVRAAVFWNAGMAKSCS